MSTAKAKAYTDVRATLEAMSRLKPGNRLVYKGPASLDGSLYAIRIYSGIKFKTFKAEEHGERVTVVQRPV